MSHLLASAVLAAVMATSPEVTDDGPPKVQFGNVQLATGVRLRYAAQGDPAGPAVILLHGYSDSWFSFSRVLPLIPSTYRVYALDQRGHGDSDRPFGGYAMRDLGADVVAFMDAMGIRSAVVLGHSMGGFVAQQVALLAPSRVKALVLVNTGVSLRHISGVAEFETAVRALSDPVSRDFAREFQYSTVMQPVPEEFMNQVISESLKLPARVWHGLMDGMMSAEIPVRVGEPGLRSMVMWGSNDAILPDSAREKLLGVLPDPALKMYPETGHAPHWERPELFARDLVAFLGAVSGER